MNSRVSFCCGLGLLLSSGAVVAECNPDGYADPTVPIGSESSLLWIVRDNNGGSNCDIIGVRATHGGVGGLNPKTEPNALSNAFSWEPSSPPGTHRSEVRELFVRPTRELLGNPNPLEMEIYRQEFFENGEPAELSVWLQSSGIIPIVQSEASVTLSVRLSTPAGTETVASVAIDRRVNYCHNGWLPFAACVRIETAGGETTVVAFGAKSQYQAEIIPYTHVQSIRFGNLGAWVGNNHTVELAHSYTAE